MNLFDQASDLLVKHMRAIAVNHNVAGLNCDADVVESGREWDFWMEAAHAAVAEALAATGKQQVGEVQGDALSVLAQLAQVNRHCHSRFQDYDGPADCAVQAAIAALAARQPAAQEVAVWVSPEQLEAHADPQRGEGGHYLPARKSSAGKFTQPLYRATPAQGIDLGPLIAELAAADSEYAEAKKRYHTVSAMSGAAGGRASCRTAYERELTAKSRLDAAVRTLIDQRDAAPGVGNG